MIYRILQNHHGARGLHFRLHSGRTMQFNVRLDPSCYYVPRKRPDGECDEGDMGVSKITGFSGLIPGRTSVRLGWRCTGNTDENCIEIWAYYHIKGQHIERMLCQARCGDVLEVQLLDAGDRYSVIVMNKESGFAKYDSIGKPWTAPFGFTHFPWFGGVNTAPHDMTLAVW